MLADIVRTPDTIRESGRNLLAYRVRGGHYPRPDAIRCDTGAQAYLYVSTEQHLHGVNCNRGDRGRGLTGGGQRHYRLQKETTETETRSQLATVYACTISGWSIPGKI